MVTVILLAMSWLRTDDVGGVGSPSLMIDDVLGHRVALSPFRPLIAIWSEGSKSGMSPGVIRSMARSIVAPAVADRPEGEQPGLLAFPVEHPGVVVARQRVERGLGDDLLPVVPLGDLAGVHDHDHGAEALDLQRLDLHVDGQRLLDRGVHPAAGAEAVAAAEHDQPGPHVVHVRLEELVLRLGEGVLGDVGQDHRVVRLKLRQVGRKRVAADGARAVDLRRDQGRDLELLLPEGPDQLGVLAGRPLDQEDLRRAAHVGEPLGDVVDRAAVAAVLVGDELGGERVEVGLGDQLLEVEDVDPALELDRLRLLVAGAGAR